jgi:hypothetical protein
MATGFIDDIPPEDLEAAGILTTMRKPLTKRELGQAIHSALRRASS